MKKVVAVVGAGASTRTTQIKAAIEAMKAHGIDIGLVQDSNEEHRNFITQKEKLKEMRKGDLTAMGMMLMAEAMGANLSPKSTILPTRRKMQKRVRIVSGTDRKKVKAARKSNVQRQIRAKKK